MEERFFEEVMSLSHCRKCGKEAIIDCSNCQNPIEEDDFVQSRPTYCGFCGKPFPWADSEQKKDDEESDFFGPIEK